MFRRRRERIQGQAPGVQTVQRYQMREKLVSFGDDYYIQNEKGERVFHFDGKMLRLRNTLIFQDMQGNELLHIQEKFLRVRDSMNIERDGQIAAKVHSALISPLRDRYTIDLASGKLVAQGNFLQHEFEIKRDGQKVAEVSKKWFRLADTYGVEIAPNQDDILILAVTVCIDAMSNPD